MIAFRDMEKRGQVTIFIIVGVAILAIFIWLVVYPRVGLLTNEVNPSSYLRECIQPQMDKVLPILEKQGGYYNPDNYVLYNSEKVQYLCYTAENYKPCIVQQPLLVKHVSSELQKQIEPVAAGCMQTLKDLYTKRGYQVQGGNSNLSVSIVPGSINVVYDSPLTITKQNQDNQVQTFRKFSIGVNSQLYDLLATATSIIQFSSTLGDSETLLYVQYYPDLKIEKLKKDSDTIYTLSNVVTKESFTFATRSLAWPQGYGEQ